MATATLSPGVGQFDSLTASVTALAGLTIATPDYEPVLPVDLGSLLDGCGEASPADVFVGADTARAYCRACWRLIRQRAGIRVSTGFPTADKSYDGLKCGDWLSFPKRGPGRLRTAPPPYSGIGAPPTKMAAWLPGGGKYTGALYGGDVRAAGPLRRAAAAPKPPVQTDEAALGARVAWLQGRLNLLGYELLLAQERIRELEEPPVPIPAEPERISLDPCLCGERPAARCGGEWGCELDEPAGDVAAPLVIEGDWRVISQLPMAEVAA